MKTVNNILCLLILVNAWRSQAAVWYVDTSSTGANNGISWANAWTNTTAIGWSAISAGDTIYISGGVSGLSYAAFTTAKSGSPGNRITILRSVEPGRDGVVTIAAPVQVPDNFITIDGIGWDKIVLTCNTAAGGGGGGSLYITGDDFEVKHVKFNGNYAAGGAFHTLSASFDCETCLIQYCNFFKTTGEDHINWRGNKLLTIDHCVFTTPSPPNDGSHRDLMNPYEAGGGGYDFYFTHNIVYGLAQNGFAFLFQDQAQVGDIHIAYNVFANSPYVVQFGGGNHGAKSIEMHNNVFYNTQDATFSPPGPQRNNIYYGPGFVTPSRVHNAAGAVDHSIWYNCDNFQAGDGNLNNVNPLFVDVNNPLGADGIPFTMDDGFNLKPGSRAINAGVSLGEFKDLLGNSLVGNPDIGAYEYVGLNTTNPVISVSPTSFDFGSVPANTSRELSFKVQNIGAGVLSGAVSVESPFVLVSGGAYTLEPGQSQDTIVRFSPIASGVFNQSVKFNGGGGANVTLSGTSSN